MSPVERWLWFWVLVLGVTLGCVFNAQAAFAPTPTKQWALSGGAGWTFSLTESCNSYLVAAYGADKGASQGISLVGVEASLNRCNLAQYGNPFSVIRATQTVSSCPANSTLVGAQCSCNSNFEQVGSTCVNASEVLCNALSGTETYASTPGNVNPGASSCNPTGCAATFGGTVIRVKNAQGQYVTEGAVTFTGGTCTYSAESGVTEDACPGGTQGEVNGVSTCVPYDPKLNTIETVKDSETTEEEGTETTNTTTTSSTTCANGKCTTTTDTTKTVNGVPTTKQTTTNEPQSEFCTKNPKAAQCIEGGQFGGVCGAFTCSGDAVQCAQALASQKLFCAVESLPSEVSAEAAEVVGADIPEGYFINGPSLSAPTPVSGTCALVDVSVNWIFESTLSLELSRFCQYMDSIRLMMGLFGSLAYALIVFRS